MTRFSDFRACAWVSLGDLIVHATHPSNSISFGHDTLGYHKFKHLMGPRKLWTLAMNEMNEQWCSGNLLWHGRNKFHVKAPTNFRPMTTSGAGIYYNPG